MRLNDSYRGVLEKHDAWQLGFLDKFASFVEQITSLKAKEHKQCLTRDTGKSLRNTCLGLAAASEHLFEFGFTFVPLGIFSTDSLECYFGKCRQAAGGNYFITVRNVLQKHRLDKARLAAKLRSNVLQSATTAPLKVHECQECSSLNEKLLNILPLLVSEIPRAVKETIVYVAGYVSKQCCIDYSDDDICSEYNDLNKAFVSANANLPLTQFDQFNQFFVNVNRGGLKVPDDSLVYFIYFMYIVAVTYFERGRIPCHTAMKLYCERICDMYAFVEESYQPAVFRVVCNILLNNFAHAVEPQKGRRSALKLAKLSG
jgi:hypothetical protein